ncbi:MAG: hypothetical protein HZB98_16145 [Bacteroidia bacterium]|nr:hypothetical protein [Bacteroidia bacterium]
MSLIRKLILFSFTIIIFRNEINCQTPTSESKPIAEIFTDFHVNLNDTTKTTGFGVNRAYFGYNYKADEHFSAMLMVNLGTPDDVTNGTVRRRYAYFREASIIWTNEKLRMAFGLTDTRIFRFQQRFWGKRYLANTYQSLNGYGYVADLGFALDYKFNDLISGDFTVMNGEGYLELQLDNGVKSSLGITVTPNSKIALRIYGDFEKKPECKQMTGIVFAGYRNKLFNIGAEASMKTNLDEITGHHAWGVSATGGINITEKDEIFTRYDLSSSVIPEGETEQWNYLKDGTFLICGVQHTFTPSIKLALDFQGRAPYDESTQNSNLIYLNALFKF